jgi:hypothetical protein
VVINRSYNWDQNYSYWLQPGAKAVCLVIMTCFGESVVSDPEQNIHNFAFQAAANCALSVGNRSFVQPKTSMKASSSSIRPSSKPIGALRSPFLHHTPSLSQVRYASGQRHSPIKVWPFIAIFALGTWSYTYMVKKRAAEPQRPRQKNPVHPE